MFNIPKGEVALSVSWHSHLGQIPSDSLHLMGAGFTQKGILFDSRIGIHELVTIAGRMEVIESCRYGKMFDLEIWIIHKGIIYIVCDIRIGLLALFTIAGRHLTHSVLRNSRVDQRC